MERPSARTVADRDASIGSRAEFAYGKVRAAIYSGRFRPGQRIRLTEVARWLGISSTPIRDALKRLESDGLLTFGSRRGLVVAELGREQVRELYALRDVLDGLAARLAAQRASIAEIVAMRDLVRRQSRAAKDDPATLAHLDHLFHDVIYRAARNRYLVEVLDSFKSSFALLPGNPFLAPTRAQAAVREHSAIVEAIELRDQERAEGLAGKHVSEAERIRLAMISPGGQADDRGKTLARAKKRGDL